MVIHHIQLHGNIRTIDEEYIYAWPHLILFLIDIRSEERKIYYRQNKQALK